MTTASSVHPSHELLSRMSPHGVVGGRTWIDALPHACADGYLAAKTRGSLEEAWEKSARGDWLLWLAVVTRQDSTEIAHAAAACTVGIVDLAPPGDGDLVLALSASVIDKARVTLIAERISLGLARGDSDPVRRAARKAILRASKALLPGDIFVSGASWYAAQALVRSSSELASPAGELAHHARLVRESIRFRSPTP